MLYGSIEAKQNILEELYSKFPEISKKLIEKYLREACVKEKKDGDPQAAYHCTSETW